jgi:hypothetical protein
VIVSLLGEMRNTGVGADALQRLVEMPLPQGGPTEEGDAYEATSLAMLQAKAVNGLAYLRTDGWDEVVLGAAGKHPSVVVRAEAVFAYLYNHEFDPQARDTLSQFVQRNELILIERVWKQPGVSAEVFNSALEQFVGQHMAFPPDPELDDEAPQSDGTDPHVDPVPDF